MGVLDDLEAARQRWHAAVDGFDEDDVDNQEATMVAAIVGPDSVVLAVCRAAVAYKEADERYRHASAGELRLRASYLLSAKQALLATTEGLT